MNERGTGVPPVNASQDHAQGARVTIEKRQGANLPHWTREGAWYAVTFRLWDSLPQRVIESWLFERKNIVKTAEQMKRPLSKQEEDRLAHLYSEKVERYLDAGFGSCFMKDGRIAREVANALLHFEGQRYNLAAWCVMPNHVHVDCNHSRDSRAGRPCHALRSRISFIHGSHSAQKKLTSC